MSLDLIGRRDEKSRLAGIDYGNAAPVYFSGNRRIVFFETCLSPFFGECRRLCRHGGGVGSRIISLDFDGGEQEQETKDGGEPRRQGLFHGDPLIKYGLGAPVLLKNSIWRLYQPTGYKSNWVTTEKMATKEPGIFRERSFGTSAHSTCIFCQGERGAIKTSSMPMS